MKIFIGCSSRDEIPNKYFKDCDNLIEELFKNKNDLVFGAYNKGLMASCYNISKKYKRKVIGITPKIFIDGLLELNCDKEIVTDTISRRTDGLIEEADVLLFLPGGIGTIYELFTAIESKRSGEFDKPIIIYNSNNFFGGLFEFIEKLYTEDFTNINVRDCYLVMDNSSDIINYLTNTSENDII